MIWYLWLDWGSMTTFTLSIEIAHDIDAVWECLADLASHSEWMADAVRIDFVGLQREGVGTTMKVLTRVGPFRTNDVMVISEWARPHLMSVVHKGLVSGAGEFSLKIVVGGTRLDWNETLTFPTRLGGRVGAAIAAPFLRRIWAANLARFASSVVESRDEPA